MDDSISRQAAINEFYKYPNIHWTTLDVMAKLDELPSAQPERKRGRWIKQMDELAWWYECSVCGDYPLKDAYGHESLSMFCPNCGADMRERRSEC